MHDPLPEHKDFIHSEEFLQRLMRRQLRLSIACAAAFCIVLFGLPLLNYWAPDLMATRVGGFTLMWHLRCCASRRAVCRRPGRARRATTRPCR